MAAEEWSKVLSPFIPGLISFVLGAMWQSWRASSSETASQLNDLLKEIRTLEDLATEYWTADPGNNEEQLQVKIRGTSFAIAGFESQIDTLFHNHADNYRNESDLLMMCCMEGGFETSERKADCPRAVQVRQLAASVGTTIRKARQDSAGLTSIFWEVVRLLKSIYLMFARFLSIFCDRALFLPTRMLLIGKKIWSCLPVLF